MVTIPPGAALPPSGSASRSVFDSPYQELFDRLKARPIINVPVIALAAGRSLVTGACLLVHWSLRETAQGAAFADLYDGGDATGELVGSLAMIAGAAAVGGPGVEGGLCLSGLYFNRLAGTWQGSIWIRA